MNEIPVLTTPIVQGVQRIEYKGLVTARNVRAVNPDFPDSSDDRFHQCGII